MNTIFRWIYLLDINVGILCAKIFKKWVPEPYRSLSYHSYLKGVPDIIKELGGVEYLSMFIDISDIYLTRCTTDSYTLTFLYKNINKTLMWGEIKVTGGIDLDISGLNAVEVFIGVQSFMNISKWNAWDLTIGDWEHIPQRSNESLIKDLQKCMGRKIGF